MSSRSYFLASPRPLNPGCFLFASLAVALTGSLRAQEPTASPTPALQIIQQQTVDVGSHRIIFNRVVPPPPQPTPTPPAPVAAAFTPTTPTPRARAAAGSKRVTRSAGASANAGEEDAEPRALFLSATVYDGGIFTELRGPDAAGGWRAWSNVDFLLLAGTGQFTTASGATYSLYMTLGTDTSESLTQAGLYPSNLAALSGSPASYYFSDGATATAHPEAAAALDALHLHADAYRPQLLQAYQQRLADQATRAAQAEWARQHPTLPPDTVINFWPKQNSVFLGH